VIGAGLGVASLKRSSGIWDLKVETRVFLGGVGIGFM
jgi:hypothetical protein